MQTRTGGWGLQEARIVHEAPANVGKANMHLFGGDSLKFHELVKVALDLPKVKNLSSERGMTTCTIGSAFPEVTKELSFTHPFPFCVEHFYSRGEFPQTKGSSLTKLEKLIFQVGGVPGACGGPRVLSPA